MTGPGRARILGDERRTVDEPMVVGRRQSRNDAALARLRQDRIRRPSPRLVAKLRRRRRRRSWDTPSPVSYSRSEACSTDEVHEPFGFLDGVSQPVMRGTYQGLARDPIAIHLVEPGEFILGYPDNRGNLPPGPELLASDDPAARLPIRCDGGAAGLQPECFRRAARDRPQRLLPGDPSARTGPRRRSGTYCEGRSRAHLQTSPARAVPASTRRSSAPR